MFTNKVTTKPWNSFIAPSIMHTQTTALCDKKNWRPWKNLFIHSQIFVKMPLKCRNNGVKKELIKSLPSPFFSLSEILHLVQQQLFLTLKNANKIFRKFLNTFCALNVSIIWVYYLLNMYLFAGTIEQNFHFCIFLDTSI